MALIEISNLTVRSKIGAGLATAVENVDLVADAGETLAILGETGSGRSSLLAALAGLSPKGATVSADGFSMDGVALDPARRDRAGRAGVFFIPAEAGQALNPKRSIGAQVEDVVRKSENLPRRDRKARMLSLLADAGFEDADKAAAAKPDALGAVDRFRAVLAVVAASAARLILVDAPATGLAPIERAQILDLLAEVARNRLAVVIITVSDPRIAAEIADRIVVLYAGAAVETGPSREVIEHPRHPYTKALLDVLPERNLDRGRLHVIPGQPPAAFDRPGGCLYGPRCPRADEACRALRPEWSQGARCLHPMEAEA